jgi:oxidase EvaA
MTEVAGLNVLRHADSTLSARIHRSAQATEGVLNSNDVVRKWLAERGRAQSHEVELIDFSELRNWSIEAGTGNLVHDSGRFFSVQGLRVELDRGPVRQWSQPIINQPEIGILGIPVREIDGVLHLLMQAKSEPGNINGVQLSPAVQATKSNYSRVHQGNAVPYLEQFVDTAPNRVIADVLQSEQGSWFYRKRNRNMVIEVGDDVEAAEDFCWLTLGQVQELLRVDNLVNMDARTVLSCLPAGTSRDRAPMSALAAAVRRSADGSAGSLHTTVEILSWMTTNQAGQDIRTTPIPLSEVEGWRRTDRSISHERGAFFSVVAVNVATNSREVASWTQPLIEPHGIGVVAFLAKRVEGTLHVLVNARVEPGYLDVVELAPTVQCTPESYAHLPSEARPPFLDVVLAATPDRKLFDVEMSEEGGRFYHARSRYQIIEVDEDFPEQDDPSYRWMTLNQLTGLLRHSHYVNVQARSLVACLRGLR